VAVDLLVEVIDERHQDRLHQPGHGMHAAGVVVSPAHVLLQFLVVAVNRIGVHRDFVPSVTIVPTHRVYRDSSVPLSSTALLAY
jgi:hypothetical protein